MRKALMQKIDLTWYKLRGKDLEIFHPYGVAVHLPKGEQTEIRHLLASGKPYEQAEIEGVRDFVPSGQDVLGTRRQHRCRFSGGAPADRAGGLSPDR